MSRVGVLVLGPAGVGKTTFCNSLVNHMQQNSRHPAAEPRDYEFTIDIKDLISLDDCMDEMNLGPNGDEEIGDYNDEFFIIDLPGQIELYNHYNLIPRLVNYLKYQLNINLCVSYLLESSFVIDESKFFSGCLSAMSAMILLELPHINILSKVDLVKNEYSKKKLKKFLNPDPLILNDDLNKTTNPRYHNLNNRISNLVDDFGMVQFLPLEAGNPDSVRVILSYIDDITQWSEGQEPKEPKDEIEIDDL
ncbi:hypothetical protein ACO0OL_002920 [Hanseniaspora opuntiae]